MVKRPSAGAGDIRGLGSISGLGRSPGGGHGNSLQCSCLENPMDRGAWRAIVHGVAKSGTRLKRLSAHTHVYIYMCILSLEPPSHPPPVPALQVIRERRAEGPVLRSSPRQLPTPPVVVYISTLRVQFTCCPSQYLLQCLAHSRHSTIMCR